MTHFSPFYQPKSQSDNMWYVPVLDFPLLLLVSQMSFRPRSLHRRKSTVQPLSTESSLTRSRSRHRPISRDESPSKPPSVPLARLAMDPRRAYVDRQTPIIAPAGTVFAPRGRQPLGAGASAFPPSQSSTPFPSSVSSSSSPTRASSPWVSHSDFPLYTDEPEEEEVVAQHRVKFSKQWVTWTSQVIPRLLSPYLELLRRTESLRILNHDRRLRCTCRDQNGKTLKVLCLHFDSTLHVCLL